MSWEAAVECETMLRDGHVSSEQSTIPQDLPRGGAKKWARQASLRDEADEEEVIDELCNAAAADKKRRLTSDQVKYLEMSFVADLKLEPQRKALIAKHLGIRPRQVAIWFQNRRARWKNKQLEQEFEALKGKYDAEMKERENQVKEHSRVVEENQKLQAEVARLKALLQASKPSPIAPVVEAAGLMIKEEELSGKSEVASPTTKSSSNGPQSENLQDSGQSCCSPEETVLELHAPSVLPCVKLEPECMMPLPPIDDAFGSLVQRLIANGFDLDRLCNYEDDLFHDGLSIEGNALCLSHYVSVCACIGMD